MQFSQILSCGLLIILVCWLGVNNAIPLGSDPDLKVIPTTTFQPITKFFETTPITVEPIVTSTPISKDSKDHTIKNDGGPTQSHHVRKKSRQNPLEVSDRINDPNIHIGNSHSSFKSHNKDSEEWEIPPNKINSSAKCVNEERRKNQTYTRSIPLNTSSINFDEDFKIPGEPEAKKTSSVHIGEDIAICWIETTTIKEDNHSDPPKRLVIREYTISFENSASIPDSYLECNDIEGEIAPGDEETIRKTALHEVIVENSKRSREVNFTHVSTVGRIIVRQHKKVKCGVGAVVSKDIFEWPDGTENPKRRVEIKVGPSIRDLRSTTDDEHAECTGSVPGKVKTEQNRTSSSTPSDTTLPPCENDDCSSNVTSCENDDCSDNVTSCEGNCSTKSLSEETTYSPSSDELLSTGVTEATSTMEPKGTSVPSQKNPDRHQNETCSDSDTDCMVLQSTTVKPEKSNETFENCSDGNCLRRSSEKSGEGSADGSYEESYDGSSEGSSEGSSKGSAEGSSRGSAEGSSNEIPCDLNSDASCSCSGDNCGSNKNSTNSTESSDKITTETSQLCKNASEPCICNGSSCLTQDSSVTVSFESDDKLQTDVLLNQTNEMTTNDFEKLSHGTTSSQMDSKCNNETGSCPDTTLPPQFKPEEGQDGIPTVEPKSSEQIGTTKIPDFSETAKPPGEIRDTPGTADTTLETTKSNNAEEYFPPTEHSTTGEIPKTSSTTCLEGDQGCTTSQLNKESVTLSNSPDKMTDTTSGNSGTETISLNSEESTSKTIITSSDNATEIPTTKPYQEIDHSYETTIDLDSKNSTDENTTTTKMSTDSIATASYEKMTSEKRSVTDCATDSDNSTDCIQVTVTNLPIISTVPSVLGSTILPTKSCNDSENCESSSSRSDEANVKSTDKPESQNKSVSNCEDGDESCQDASSKSDETSCDSASGSCSSEDNDSGINGTVTLTSEETKRQTTLNVNISSIGETRRSMTHTTPLPTATKKPPRLALKIQILLERIDENKDKEKLVQVEKHLLLNENSTRRGNKSLMWQLQALNNSMNMETLNAIFNCSALKTLSANAIDIDNLSKDAVNDEIENLKKGGIKDEEKGHSSETTVIPPQDNSRTSTDNYDGKQNVDENSNMKLNHRKKREILSSLDITTEIKNYTDSTTAVSVENGTEFTTLVSVENSTDSTTVFSVENGTDSTNLVYEENVTDSTTLVSLENVTDSTTFVSVENVNDSTTLFSVENVTDSTTVVSVENVTDSTTEVPMKKGTDSTTVVSMNEGTDSATVVPMKKGTDSTTEKAIPKSLPEVEEDLTNGMDHVLSFISKELGESATIDMNTTPSSFSSKILKILSDPSDRRIHFVSPRITPRIKRAVTILEMENPVDGEEIKRWSRERFARSAGGGQIRRLTEFRILRHNSEDF